MKLLRIVSGIILLLILSVFLFLRFSPEFGDAPNEESLERIKASENFDGEKFVNKTETTLDTSDPETKSSMLSTLYQFIYPAEEKNPMGILPSEKFKASTLFENSFAWLGHSTILMKTGGAVILIDPIFSNASPIPGTVTPFKIQHPTKISDLPEKIDVVLISHDHYDHLDYQSIRKLDDRVDQFLVPLGVKAHLLSWGVAEEKIQEKDWYDTTNYKGVTLTMTPARHFSGRGLTNRYSTLWASWVVSSPDLTVFFSGDSGYFDGFKTIGEQFGPFDIAFIENGAYNEAWSEIHMYPEESVQANIDLESKVMFPIHWGKFDLAKHTWTDSITRASKEAARKQVILATPLVGQVFTVESIPSLKWWEQISDSDK